MTSLLTAISFLTILPVPRGRSSPGDFRASLAFFPAVGLLLGLVLWAVDRSLDDVLGAPLTSATLLVTLVVMTRGLHMEGFLDTCDGLLGGHSRERRLEIMRDSHVGAFAAMGGCCLLLLKWTALWSLAAPARPWTLLLFPALSRWAMVMAVSLFPYARPQGLGAAFHGGSRVIPMAIAGVIALAAALLLAGLGGLAFFGLALLLALLLGMGLSRLLGGLTGDTYGALNETTETVVLMAAVGLTSLDLIKPLTKLIGGT